MEIQFGTLQEAKAAQVLLWDYAITSEVDEHENILFADEKIIFEEEDWNYIEAMVNYLGDELLMDYDISTYRNMFIEMFGIIELDEYVLDLSLCLCNDELAKIHGHLPVEDGYYDVYVHYNRQFFASTRNNDIVYTTEEIAQLILEDEEWNRVDSIRLVSCFSGTTQAYQEIANIIKAPVKAPLGRIIIIPSLSKFWVVPDEWVELDASLSDEERFMAIKAYFARMYLNNDIRLSDEIQATLWVES